MKSAMRMLGMLAVLLFPAAAAAQATDLLDPAREAMSGSMTGILESQLGVTADQAEGGIGSMLSLAREKLDADQFQRLAGAIPGAEGYLEAAKRLGAVTGPLQNLTQLNEALGRLGIPPETAARFIPAATELVGQFGGEEAGNLLASALGSS